MNNITTVTPQMVDDEIDKEAYYRFPGTNTTVCLLTLHNGFSCIGESACVSDELFDPEIGKSIAKEKAKDKIWMVLGFRLMEELKNGN